MFGYFLNIIATLAVAGRDSIESFECPSCGVRWHFIMKLDPYKTGHEIKTLRRCLKCDRKRWISSGIIEKTVTEKVENGFFTEREALEIIVKLLGEQCLVDTYGEDFISCYFGRSPQGKS